jgi:acetylornithine/succinyldiaminopimelate/putrescine aminotransferase
MQKQKLVEESARKGEILHEMLSKLPLRTHGKGLLAGLELKDREEVKEVVKLCLERNVEVCDTGRKWVKIGPALNIDEETLMQGIKILMEVVEEVVHGRKVESTSESGSPETQT